RLTGYELLIIPTTHKSATHQWQTDLTGASVRHVQIHKTFTACAENSPILLGPYEILSVASQTAHGTNHRITLVMANGECFQLVFNEEFYHSGFVAEWVFVRLYATTCPTKLADCVPKFCWTEAAYRTS
ncbi:hypothetical protein P879_10532, partial [Paragonimus westermani]